MTPESGRLQPDTEASDETAESAFQRSERLEIDRFAGTGGTSSWRETLIAILVVAAIIQIGSFLLPRFILPGWQDIWPAILQIRVEDVTTTVARVAVALVVSFVGGLLIAILSFAIPMVDRIVIPVVRLFMAVPVIAWIMFTILWFPGIELRILFVLTVICAPIFALDILDAMRSIPKSLRDMLHSYRPRSWQVFTKLMLPGSLPTMFTSWKVNISLGIRVVTIAELVGAVSGMGFAYVRAQNLFATADVFALTVVLVALLMLSHSLVILIERRALKWRS